MNIFLVLNPAGNLSIPESKTWLYNLYEPLLDLGHSVYLLRIDFAERILGAKLGSESFREKFSDHLLETFKHENKKNHFDLFLSYLIDIYVDPSAINLINKFGVPTANFSCNNAHQFKLTKNISKYFTFNLHSEKDADQKFRDLGVSPVWFPMAANPKYYHPIDTDKIYDVSFIGGNYSKRSFYISFLLDHGVDVHCFGPNWLVNKPHHILRNYLKEYKRFEDLIQAIFSFSAENRCKYSSRVSLYDFNKYLRGKYYQHFHYPVSDEIMIKHYSQSKISLGFLEVHDNHDPSKITKQHLHLREFEAPMSGALYFTNYCQELEEFYVPDKEVVVYRNEYELYEKINFYLSHPVESKIIRDAGYKRALECHTYQKRFSDLFSKIFI